MTPAYRPHRMTECHSNLPAAKLYAGLAAAVRMRRGAMTHLI